jgi:hypothetical protein
MNLKDTIMNNRNLIIILLGLLIALVLIDILTGIFYWNRSNLIFDAANYNNIVTPTATVLAFVVYTITLLYLIRQTKIAQSQNMKPFFEAKLKALVSKGENVKIEYRGSQNVEKYNALTYVAGLQKLFEVLKYDTDFVNDINNIGQVRYKQSDIEDKPYYDRLNIIFEILNDNSSLLKFYQDIIDFLSEIEKSTMTNEDKFLLKKEVIDILLKDYIDFMRLLDTTDKFNPLIPILYIMDTDNVEFKKLNETKFRDCYDNCRPPQ